jgi:hypothetical protein
MWELSRRQRVLWRFSTRVPAALGNRTVVYRFDGQVDSRAVEDALRASSAAHLLLRLTLRCGADTAVLVETGPPRLERIEVTDPAGLTDVARRLHAEPMVRTGGPMWRGVLVHGAVQALVLVMHTLVVDRRSIELVVAAVGAGYAAACGAGPGPIPGEDYFQAWQRYEELCARRGTADLEWWREELADAGPLALPEDRAETAPGVGPSISRTETVLPAAAAHRGARDQRLSVYAAGVGGLAAVLAGWTARRTMRLGASVDLRPLVDGDNVVGPLSQGTLLPITVEPVRGPAGAAVAVQRAVLAALGHQAVPFESMAALLLTAGLPAEQIARVTVDQMIRPAPRRWGPLGVSRFDADLAVPVGAGSDLHLNVADDPATGSVSLTLDANAGRFSLDRVAALLAETVQAMRSSLRPDPEPAP